MFKFIALILLIIVIAGGVAWYSAQSLPSWFDESVSQEDVTIEHLSEEIRRQGVAKFLGAKFSDVLDGSVAFNETEFNAILLASLKADTDGQKLLSVSDAVKAFIQDDEIELTAIINLDKLEKVEPKAREAVEKFDRIFPFLNDSRVALTVYGTPVARNGNIAIRDDFHIKVGAIPISNESLRALGAQVERANTTDLELKYLALQSINLKKGEIEFGVLPRF